MQLARRQIPTWRELTTAAGAFGIACLAWAIPLLLSEGGSIRQLWRAMSVQAGYVQTADSLLAAPMTRQAVVNRLAEFGSVFTGAVHVWSGW